MFNERGKGSINSWPPTLEFVYIKEDHFGTLIPGELCGIWEQSGTAVTRLPSLRENKQFNSAFFFY